MHHIRLATTDDLVPLWEHGLRHVAESGREGDFIFSPIGSPVTSFDRFCDAKEDAWAKTPTTPGWARCWLLVDDDAAGAAENGEILGSLELAHEPALESMLHRAVLTTGLERPARARGFGSALMKTALDWARATPSLEWIQLFVFAHNEPAVRLYERFGFYAVGRTPDFFRLHGESITDVAMVLRLRTG